MIARKNFEIWAVMLGSLAAGAAYAFYAGEDINWDWRNYHEYSAFAWLHGRLNEDVAPAGVQNFFNPLAYLPAYLLRHHAGAPYWGMLLGAIHGLNLALIYWFTRILLASASSGWMLAAAVIIGAFGPMTLSEVGTSFADILTALPVIAGLGLILSAEAAHRTRYLVAAMLIGGAVGLKLTNMVFLVGAGASLLLAPRPLAAMAYFAVGAVAGTLGTGGAWGWSLWQEFGNPVFPFYNTVFHSPEAPLDAITDVRFMPHSLWEAVAYPFYWAVGNYRSSEYPFRDPRFAIALVLFAANAGLALLTRMRVFTRRDKLFLLFFLVAYAMWLLTFSIHRYAVVLELLTAPLVVLLFSRLLRALQLTALTPGRPPWSHFATVGLAVAIALWSQPADWLRRPWSDPYDPRLPAALASPSTYLLIEKPLGYVVPLLGPESRAYQLSDIVMPIVPGGLLDRRVRDGLAHPRPGGVWALHLRGSAPRQCLLDEYGWRFDTSRSCAIIPGADGVDIEACPLQPSQPKSRSGDC
ncbi:glycosyltransferase family 87 protein [Bradyrhizobium sp.]|uniref:glycosyltransferase family 87 protein n=1 Tax=Bradyrhizobium sp. TaxID=376 RepID=UPI0025BEA61A|nr:glycosyltransferase family 87 protein [Bradyrhizobium sp.]